MKQYKPDPLKFTPEQRDKMETWTQNKQKLTYLSDIADMSQDISSTLDKWKKDGKKDTDKLGALLVDVKESLGSLNSKEAPEMPDYAKPVVKAVDGLKKALEASIKGIEVQPKVNLPAPNVNVEAVDLSKLEKIIKTDIPKAFKDSIKLIPETEIPEADYTPLTELMTTISEKLDSIDTGVRLKPQMPVYATNASNQLIVDTDSVGGNLIPGSDYDYLSITNSDTDEDTLVFKDGGSGGTTKQTIVITYAAGAGKASDDVSVLEWS